MVTLINLTDDQLLFRLRTTAPDRYTVRPKLSVVPALGELSISIFRGAMKPETNTENDQFLFMAAIIERNVSKQLTSTSAMER